LWHSQEQGEGTGTAIEIAQVRITDPDVTRLVAEVQEEYVQRYGGPDETPLQPAMFEPPSGAFFLGRLAGAPVAIGGWRFRPDVTAFGRARAAEVKRMFVVPARRGAGHARAVLSRLESSAREAGADLMVLETGLKQPEAIALYASSGYEPVEPFGHYAWSPTARYFGKAL
jgi:GNAT superfamily N-acetyltransferase